MRGAWLLAWCLVGCGAEIGGDEAIDGGPSDASTQGSDGAPPNADAALPDMESTVFAAPDINDTFVRLSNPTLNYGGSERMCADTTTDDRRMLLRIDVTALPIGSQVVEANLHVWTGGLMNDLSTQIYSVYPMLEAWSEGNQNAVAGTASWNERTSGTAWTTAGAGNGSRGDTAMGSFVPDAIDTEYIVALEPDLVAGWVDDPGSNYGIAIVAAGSDGACFTTSEFATAGKRPTLVVTWIAP